MKDINILIVHYNTPELTECLVKSINKQVKTNRVANIYIFDNSNERTFTYRQDNIRYIDNTQKQIIDFEKWGENYPDKMEPFYSSKHCYTVQTFMDMVGEPFILMDSDILLKRDITDFWNEDMGFIGQSLGKRVLPFICFINPKILKERGITYFDDRYTYDLNKDKTGTGKYDTGYTLWLNKGKIPHKDVRYFTYIVHYEGGSYAKKYFERNHKGQITKERWLERNKHYWSDEPQKNYVMAKSTDKKPQVKKEEPQKPEPEPEQAKPKEPIVIKDFKKKEEPKEEPKPEVKVETSKIAPKNPEPPKEEKAAPKKITILMEKNKLKPVAPKKEANVSYLKTIKKGGRKIGLIRNN